MTYFRYKNHFKNVALITKPYSKDKVTVIKIKKQKVHKVRHKNKA